MKEFFQVCCDIDTLKFSNLSKQLFRSQGLKVINDSTKLFSYKYIGDEWVNTKKFIKQKIWNIITRN